MTWTTQPRSEAGALAVVKSGAGPRLLLIHGVGLRAEAWNAQIAALSGRFEILAPDLPGHGESTALPANASLQDFGDAVAHLLDRPTVIAGHSMGAMIALDVASRYPDRVQGVAALNAIYRRSASARKSVQDRANSLSGAGTADPEATLTRWFGNEPSPERQACKDWLIGTDPSGYRSAYTVFASEDGPSEASLKALRCPALFLTGALEPNSTPLMSEAMAELARNGTARIVEGAAHMMPMTHSQIVNRVLSEFAGGCSS
ncbi:alpha/beta fold hydrolase [Roseibium sp. MMSF_3544]|uniref:alpha/beta fold hydrolase n=1 Tax=unclassified Roseibium TaxID=2629323 RepID=UPI00273EAD7F|nr:alpha/beta hydrolase [Roseibium sp. MMSF_3544]